jgi:N-acetylmuramoyl-L-alanine amidase CwlA
MKANIEITDTFGGESNYAWVRRYTLDLPDMCTTDYAVRQVKRHIDWTGKRCAREEYHDQVVLRPRGECVVCFINFI